MERDVASPLQHDVKRMLDEQQRPVEARPNREAGAIVEGAGLRRRLEIEQGSDVRARVVVSPVHARLEVRQLGEGLVARSPSQQLAAGRESHVDAGEGLYVLVVQRSRDALPLARRLELAQACFDDQPLLAEIS